MQNRLLVSTRKGLFIINQRKVGDPRRWVIDKTAFIGDPVSFAMRDPRDGALYAALNLGHFGSKLHRSRDGGESWQEIAMPTLEGEPPDQDGGDAPSVQMIWALEPSGPDEPGVLWCGTLPGALFRSEDHGESWQLNRPLWNLPERGVWAGGGYDVPGIHSICVDPIDSRHVTVGVSIGGVWVTLDDGQSWKCGADGMRAEYLPPEQAMDPLQQDPHLVVQCRETPAAFWAQHHNGIFRSTNACASWHEIKDAGPSVFGFAVAVHPAEADTAWFVPAVKDECRVPVDGKLVVTRTRDGGRSFDVLTEGLPQEHAYDLVYRHALAVDDTGDRLAFGSTTGALFVSENGGDAWHAINTHLPPIYAVRFIE